MVAAVFLFVFGCAITPEGDASDGDADFSEAFEEGVDLIEGRDGINEPGADEDDVETFDEFFERGFGFLLALCEVDDVGCLFEFNYWFFCHGICFLFWLEDPGLGIGRVFNLLWCWCSCW